MTWERNKETEVTTEDTRGFIGEFGRSSGGVATYIAVKSPDGATRYITVDNTGAVSSSTTKP